MIRWICVIYLDNSMCIVMAEIYIL